MFDSTVAYVSFFGLCTGSIGIAMEYMFSMGKCMQTRRNYFLSFNDQTRTYKDVCVCVEGSVKFRIWMVYDSCSVYVICLRHVL